YIFSTKEMSNISFKGEFAYMSPDPNTKKSTISSDGGKSIAYIDDFEGAKRIIPIGVSYTGWRDLSVPDNIPTIPEPLDKDQLMRYKGKSYWYNVLPSDVYVENIWGNRKSVAREDRQVTVLDYVFDPTRRGTYNKNPKLDEPQKMWGGIMRLLSSTASNLVEENIEFIEFYLNLKSVPDDAKLYIDLGQISEDVIPNGVLDSEDKNQNDLVDEGEDTGIDGITDAQERALDTLNLGNDPANDNFSFTLTNNPDYSKINGTEGNAALTDVGRLPDTEDLNRNFTLDRLNSYFRYEVKLDSTSDFIAGGGDGTQKWYLFRVPLKDFKEKIGDPTFTLVEYIRFWVSGVQQPLHLRFAELNLVGNQW
ncbi:MAG: cell surface protein SprA, partial [Methanobacteriota archaeon]